MPKPRLVVGLQPVREALRVHQGRVLRVGLQRGATRLTGLRKLAEDCRVPVSELTREELDRAAAGQMHQGAIADAPPLELRPLSHVLESELDLVIALDGIQDPQNFGAVVRSAVGIARVPILWAENSSAPLTPATFRASAGAIEHATLCRVTSLPHALADLKEAGFAVVGLDGHAPEALYQQDLMQATVVVVGGEGRGLSRSTRRCCTSFASVVGRHTIDSLNASVAAALALYEADRQRQIHSVESS